MKKYLIPFILSAAFLVVGIFTLSDYGINWDGPLHMLKGQAYSQLFLNSQKKTDQPSVISPVLVNPNQYISRYYFASVENGDNQTKPELPLRPLHQIVGRNSFYQHQNWDSQYFKTNDWYGHPPFIDILGAFSNRFFWGMFGWFGDIGSYQLLYILVSSIGVFIVSVFSTEITGSIFAGLVAGLSLALFPLFFADAHINMKDPEQAVFFAGSIWAFYNWIKQNRTSWFIVFTLFVSFALATKWNIVFLAPIFIIWLILIRKLKEFEQWFNFKRLRIKSLIFLFVVISILTISWPYYWTNPLGVIFTGIKFYWENGTGGGSIQPEGFILPLGFNSYPLILLFSQIPEVILFLAGFGIWAGFKIHKKNDLKVNYLLILWLIIPILRIIMPGARSYGGLRQFMEVLPAMAILAGIGADCLVSVIPGLTRNLYNKWIPAFAGMTVVGVIFALLLIPLIRLHPNENAYFNNLVGGLKGAVDKNLVDWTLTYGNIYKKGTLWLNEQAEKDANLAHLDGSMFAISPLYLRPDISISPNHFSGFEKKGEYIMTLFNPLDPPVFASRYVNRFLMPVKTIDVQNVPLLSIYKNDLEHTYSNFKEESVLENFKVFPVSDKDSDYLRVDLGQDLSVTRITVLTKDPRCIGGIDPNEIIAINPKNIFLIHEIKDLGQGLVEYYFAGEKTKIIKIYPKNSNSCFVTGQVKSISYLIN